MASISIRKSIRWLPGEAEEPTLTVVLTSPARRFVDLRIVKPAASATADADESDARLPFSRLDWAIAGTSSSTTRDDVSGGVITHGKWTHWIDSTTRKASGVVDEGDMVTQADGTTLETGSMVNPATGRVTAYEEVWEDEEPAAPCVVLEVDEGDGDDDGGEGKGKQGRVVRLGRWCQGFVREGEKIALERWLWSGETNKWRRTVRMGDLDVACEAALEEGREFKVGERVGEDGAWRVVEVVDG
ncbi:sodium/nucleoside cotransporter [Purpureocillium lilacinum]|uniref:Protein HRI1 n=1 Tax=Purpureocillium lilacinum TaxID=33203 RepID=A0A179GBJ8_PURLI|nr:sodium/nucleoside cotransporter [Purpureocillium lilacinum]